MTFKAVFALAVLILVSYVLHAARKYHWISHFRATPQRALNWWRKYNLFAKISVGCGVVAVIAFGLGQYLGDSAGGFVRLILMTLVLAGGWFGFIFLLCGVAGFTFTALFGTSPANSRLDTVVNQKAHGNARASDEEEVDTALGGKGKPVPQREFEE